MWPHLSTKSLCKHCDQITRYSPWAHFLGLLLDLLVPIAASAVSVSADTIAIANQAAFAVKLAPTTVGPGFAQTVARQLQMFSVAVQTAAGKADPLPAAGFKGPLTAHWQHFGMTAIVAVAIVIAVAIGAIVIRVVIAAFDPTLIIVIINCSGNPGDDRQTQQRAGHIIDIRAGLNGAGPGDGQRNGKYCGDKPFSHLLLPFLIRDRAVQSDQKICDGERMGQGCRDKQYRADVIGYRRSGRRIVIEYPASQRHCRAMMKTMITIFAICCAAPASAACYADYKAKQDSPLKLHYGVVELPDDACDNHNAAARDIERRLSRAGWQLLEVNSIFDESGLSSRQGRAGAFFLKF